jgi:uncharacterized RDD family membrane protein YckC
MIRERVIIASARAVGYRERVDLSTRATAKQSSAPFSRWYPCLCPARLWLLAFSRDRFRSRLTMTGLTNTASDDDLAVPGPLCDSAAEVNPEFIPAPLPGPEAWRSEVAARLARYRTRRKPRAPRYPSLLLPFDSSDNRSRPSAAIAPSPVAAPTPLDRDFQGQVTQDCREVASVSPHSADRQTPPPEPEPSSNILEFPRSAAIPVVHASLLADPIFDRPRIVEAPEVLPPPPALGGILIEAVEPSADAHTADARIRSASIHRRLLATVLDGLIVASALSAFAAIFLRFNPVRSPLPLVAGLAAVITVLLWAVYQFLFVVYTGSTPGLRAARLKIANFDGSPANRRVRRWRVLASFLSAASAGLGYLWCFLDQDSLCWHDRITRTLLQPSK